jgi:uncharacterized membrane protein
MSEDAHEKKMMQVEAVISGILHWGVLASIGLIVLGTLLCFVRSGDYGAGGGAASDLHRLLTQGPAFPRTAGWFARGLARADGMAVVVAGLLLLIATPVIRVAVSIAAFGVGKDRAYVIITSVVLALLLISFFLGKAG